MRSATTVCCLLLSAPSAGAFAVPRRGVVIAGGRGRSPPDDAPEDPHSSVAALAATADGGRRGFLSGALPAAAAACASLVLPPRPPAARAADAPGGSGGGTVVPYRDEDYGFQISVPATWEVSRQRLSGRRRGVFFTDPGSRSGDDGTIETLGYVAYTPLRDDFTSLGSFGSVDDVAQATILPKGELAGGDSGSSEMISAVKDKNAYVFDYVATPTVPAEGGPSMTRELKTQHFRTIFTLLPFKDNAGLTLVTITIQTTQDRYDGATKRMFDDIIGSYGKIS